MATWYARYVSGISTKEISIEILAYVGSMTAVVNITWCPIYIF